jgi:hypothetical protein
MTYLQSDVNKTGPALSSMNSLVFHFYFVNACFLHCSNTVLKDSTTIAIVKHNLQMQ